MQAHSYSYQYTREMEWRLLLLAGICNTASKPHNTITDTTERTAISTPRKGESELHSAMTAANASYHT